MVGIWHFKAQLERSFAIIQRIQVQVPGVNALIDSVKKLFERIDVLLVQPTAMTEEDQARLNRGFENFFARAGVFLESMKRYNSYMADQKPGVGMVLNSAEILRQFGDTFEQLPGLIDAFNDIGLDVIFSDVSRELGDASTYIERNLPEKMHDILAKVSELILNPQSLTDLSKGEQAIRLQIMSEANFALQKIVLTADELEVKLSRAEGSIVRLDVIRFGKERKTIHEWCEMFTEAYRQQLNAAGYTSADTKIDFYPFEVAKLLSREEMKKKFLADVFEFTVFEEEKKQRTRELMISYLQDERAILNELPDTPFKISSRNALLYLIVGMQLLSNKCDELSRSVADAKGKNQNVEPLKELIFNGLKTEYMRNLLAEITRIQLDSGTKVIGYPEGNLDELTARLREGRELIVQKLRAAREGAPDNDDRETIDAALTYLDNAIIKEQELCDGFIERNPDGTLAAALDTGLASDYIQQKVKPRLDRMLARVNEECQRNIDRNENKLRSVIRLIDNMKANYSDEELAEKIKMYHQMNRNRQRLIEETHQVLLREYNRFRQFVSADDFSEVGESSVTVLDRANLYLNNIRAALSEVIDPEIFNRYFNHDLNLSRDHGLVANSWIKDLGAAFLTAEKAVMKLTTMQQEVMANSKGEQKVGTPDEFLLKMIQDSGEVSKQVTKFLAATKQLARNPFTKQSMREFSHYDDLAAVGHKVQQHRLVKTLRAKGPELVTHVISEGRLNLLLGDLEAFYQSTAEGHDRKTRDNIVMTIAQAKLINQSAAKSFDDSPARTIDVVKFCYKNIDPILKTIDGIGRVAASFGVISSEQALRLLQEANLLVRDLYLYADKLELKFYLKEGYLFKNIQLGDPAKSLDQYIRDFYTLLAEKGYEFLDEEAYPYDNDVLAQRAALLSLPNFDRAFIERRMALFKPHQVIRAPVQTEVTKGPIILEIDLKIRSLINKRDLSRSGPALLFSKASRAIVGNKSTSEDVINALIALREAYRKPGYTIGDALTSLKAKKSSCYFSLMNSQLNFVRHLKREDIEIAKDHKRKIINIPLVVRDQLFKSDWAADIVTLRMNELMKERLRWFSRKQIKNVKIGLLKELKEYLTSNKKLEKATFEQAIKRISEDHPDTYHLLYQGRTGVMMNTLHVGMLPREKMVDMIEVEIKRLEKKIATPTSFFKSSRDAKLQKRISAMRKLKEANFEESKLSSEHQAILRTYDKSLLRDVEIWRNYQSNVKSTKPRAN